MNWFLLRYKCFKAYFLFGMFYALVGNWSEEVVGHLLDSYCVPWEYGYQVHLEIGTSWCTECNCMCWFFFLVCKYFQVEHKEREAFHSHCFLHQRMCVLSSHEHPVHLVLDISIYIECSWTCLFFVLVFKCLIDWRKGWLHQLVEECPLNCLHVL